ncbi:hypothetical protein [Marinigracilibium pacificum]|uniref:Uncharacterized protein n=1 Tax=Marinigracilibium pacificum TaxID=2729599 RepID=A0A848IWE8_9BACT|nr:hypothetical protein [Marinigracilibium pacificum]NMM47605.1 hypothetical protein [Marinigracilibium pacificum]
MKSNLFFYLLISCLSTSFAQINSQDSSVQVISYWDLNETYSYAVSEEKFKIIDTDTTNRSFLTYNVDITVVDSTEKSYTIEWKYSNYSSSNENEFIDKLNEVYEGMVIRFTTDELGIFKEIINYNEVKKSVQKTTAFLKEEWKDKEMFQPMIEEVENMFMSKEAFENGIIKDIQQYHLFHGIVLEKEETYYGDIQVPNMFGGEPFDSRIAFWLDTIDFEEYTYDLIMEQSLNSEQLTKATYDFMSSNISEMKAYLSEGGELPKITKDTFTISRVHNTGWLIFSVETTEIKADKTTRIEERIIEIL